MKRVRPMVAVAALLSSLVLAFLLRDVFHELLVLPLSSFLWPLWVLYRSIPELVKWIVLVTLLGLLMVWQLVPELGRSKTRNRGATPRLGQVESLAIWIQRSRGSNYFRWHIANRLSRVAGKLDALSGRGSGVVSSNPAVASYLDAGGKLSFVDFPAPRYPFQQRHPTPLDADPLDIVTYLESQTSAQLPSHEQDL